MVGVELHRASTFGCRVQLLAEPIQTGEGEVGAQEPNASQQDDGQATAAHEVEGGGNDNEKAEPTGLPGGPEDRAGDGRCDEPGSGLGGEGRLDCPKAEVEAEDDCQEAGDIRHEAERQRDEQWGEDKGQGGEGGVCLPQSKTDEGALEENGSREGDEEDGSSGGGEGGAEELNEKRTEGEL